jgi:hypothetical protein
MQKSPNDQAPAEVLDRSLRPFALLSRLPYLSIALFPCRPNDRMVRDLLLADCVEKVRFR